MLRSLNEIMHLQLQGIDKEIGNCKDFLFDDKYWVIRYLAVDTNRWLPFLGKVLISPRSLGEVRCETHQLSVNLTREEVKNSPSFDENQPISHLYEAELFKYYGNGFYWMGESQWATCTSPAEIAGSNLFANKTQSIATKIENKLEERCLRSSIEVKGYKIHATDQSIGHIEDFILDDGNWSICYLIIKTRNWLPGGRTVIISPNCIETVNCIDGSITINVSAKVVEDSPLFDSNRLTDPQYEAHLHEYYEISQSSKYLSDLKVRL